MIVMLIYFFIFLLEINIFLVFLNCFDVILKINLKNKEIILFLCIFKQKYILKNNIIINFLFFMC
jgi:hypothetical protein